MSAIDMRERLRPFGISFEKSLEDLIKGIRAANGDSDKLSEFLDKSIQECKNELKSPDLELKSTAVLKLSYLEMYGFDMSWCSFNILEVMSSSKFQHKRIGYLAAIQILQRQNNDDALMLMTNLLKKDLNSVHYIETSLAISGIAAVVSKDLALDICDDMSKMLSHSNPLIRKKAVLAMFKIFLKNPDSLRIYYDRIVEKLDDNDNSVVSATVNVICELANMNPSNYIELAPRLYAIMKDSNNNWMVIRLLKLFSSLSLTEPRLKFKILPEIKSLMVNTKALSLIYECINSILNGKMLSSDDIETAKLIIEKLLIFFESDDQNLKYVGLLAFIKTCKIHQNLIKKYDKIILTSIYDNDLTIRETSLEIINSLVSEENIVSIVTRLTVQLLPFTEQQESLNKLNEKLNDKDDQTFGLLQQPIIVSDKYKYLLINKIIEICSMDNYENIPTFRWYLGVLTDILRLNIDNKISNVDRIISEQLVDIGIRVPSIRSQLIKICLELCGIPEKSDEELLLFKNGLSNCMWIIGEYYEEYIRDSESNLEESDSDDDDDDDSDDDNELNEKYSAIQIIDAISKQKFLGRLGQINFDKTITVYIQSIAKMFSKFCIIFGEGLWSTSQFEAVKSLAIKIIKWFSNFQNSPNFEIQERALSYIEILRLVEESIEGQIETLNSSQDDMISPPMFLVKGYNQLFTLSTIKPVNMKIQQKIQPALDLDLNESFNDQSIVDFKNLCNKLKLEDLSINFTDDDHFDSDDNNDAGENTDSVVENESVKDKRDKSNNKKDHKHDPFYISLENNEQDKNFDSEDINNFKDIKQKKEKKQSKPKKYKKEKVLVIEEDDLLIEDDNIAITTTNNATKTSEMKNPSKFLVDSSNLADVDLKQTDNIGGSIADEYNVVEEEEKELEEEEKVSSNQEIKIEPTVPTPATKRKPKKKVKKKVVVIE